MDEHKKQKLERYMRNSRRFLWGLGKGSQKETYLWLKSMGFEFELGSYASVTQELLLANGGLELVLDKVVIPKIKKDFPDKALTYLKECWYAGTNPDPTLLKSAGAYKFAPFLDYNTQYKYVEGWGEFAGLWFEEISP